MAQNAAQVGTASNPLKPALTNEQKAEIRKRAISDYEVIFDALEALKKEGAKVRQELKTWGERASADGIDPASVKIAVKLMRRPVEQVVAEHREVVKNLQVMDGPLGEQFSLFENPQQTRLVDAYLSGAHAGRSGESASNNGYAPGTEDHMKWAEGWTKGQAEIAERMAPKNGEAPKAKRASRKKAANGEAVH
jgi:hypothetical protein